MPYVISETEKGKGDPRGRTHSGRHIVSRQIGPKRVVGVAREEVNKGKSVRIVGTALGGGYKGKK